MKRYLKKIGLSVMSTLAFLVIAVIGASIRHYSKNQTFSRCPLIEYRSESWWKNKGVPAEDPNRKWENSLELHPLFGYVYNPASTDVNNYGFLSQHNFVLTENGYTIPGLNPDKSLVIGIFGGSFAQLTAQNSQQILAEKVSMLFPQYEPVLINFAVGGHALPQSAFVYTYFRNMVDVAIFIDGLNELWNYVNNNNAGYPSEYAKAAHYQYKLSLNLFSAQQLEKAASIISLQKKMKFVTELSLSPPLRHSVLTHYIWSSLAKYWQNSISKESRAVEKSYDDRMDFHKIDDRSLVRIAAKQWGQYHQLIHEMSLNSGVLDIHVIQPNPYVPGSKRVFTEKEQQIMRNDDGNSQFCVVNGYPLLRKELLRISELGAVAKDLSYIYEEREESIWVDYCHTDTIGYNVVMDEIAALIQQNSATLLKRLERDQSHSQDPSKSSRDETNDEG